MNWKDILDLGMGNINLHGEFQFIPYISKALKKIQTISLDNFI